MTICEIDLLLPFYGDPALMKETVESVRGQTDHSWRLVVVDDGYPDDGVSHWFAGLRDHRIEYQRNETNLGANANYRRALSLAKAEHLVFLGADDLLLPNYVARARKAFAEADPSVAMYQPEVIVIDEQGLPSRAMGDRIKSRLRSQLGAQSLLTGELLAASVLRGNWTYFPSICWRRDVVQSVGFRAGLHVAQDLALLLDLVTRGYSMLLDPVPTFAYRRHSGSDSSIKALNGQRFAEERAFFTTIASEMRLRGWDKAAAEARRHYTSRLNALSLLPTAIRVRDYRAGVRLARHAFNRGGR